MVGGFIYFFVFIFFLGGMTIICTNLVFDIFGA